ncbi:MAG: recombinase family protein [Flavobacteriaceae bacterium]|nr:recombinase family protein [Flavobacteriaceae bacterium]
MLGIYCRISGKKEEGKDVSIGIQSEKGKVLAKGLGMEHKIYKDEAVSGTLPIDKRPAFRQLVKDIEAKLISKVFVYDNSRLERNTEVRFKVLGLFTAYNIDPQLDHLELVNIVRRPKLKL